MNNPPMFNLADRPWIDVLDADGSPRTVSLETLLADAHQLAALDAPDPMAGAALMRLLVALAHRIAGDPESAEDWAETFSAGRFDPAAVGAYFARWGEHFDLGGDRPFYQCLALTAPAKPLHQVDWASTTDATSARVLQSRYRAGTNMDPAEAAVWLLGLQCFDTGGIKGGDPADPATTGGKVYGASAPWAGQTSNLFAQGQTLFQTLMLNVIPAEVTGRDTTCDLPSWEKDPSPLPSNRAFEPTGPVGLCTLQARRVRLEWDADGRLVGAAVCLGDQVAGGLANQHRLEPYSLWVWVDSAKAFKPPARNEVTRAWHGLAQLLPATTAAAKKAPEVTPLVVEWISLLLEAGLLDSGQVRFTRTIAGYDPKWATINHLTSDQFAVPAAAVLESSQWRAAARAGASATAAVVEDYGWLGRSLYRAVTGSTDLTAQNAASQRARTEAATALDPVLRQWLAEVASDDEPLEARRELAERIRCTVYDLADARLRLLPERAWPATGATNPAAAQLRFRTAVKRHLAC